MRCASLRSFALITVVSALLVAPGELRGKSSEENHEGGAHGYLLVEQTTYEDALTKTEKSLRDVKMWPAQR